MTSKICTANAAKNVGTDGRTSQKAMAGHWKAMEGHGRSWKNMQEHVILWKMVEYSVSVTISNHV